MSALCITWPKYWSFSFSISPSHEYSGMISFRIDLIWIYVSWFHTGLGRSPGVANGYPLQYSCLENSMDRGACGARVHVVPKNRTNEWLSTTILVSKGSLGEYKLRSQSRNGIRSVSPELTLTCRQRLLWIPFPVAQMVKNLPAVHKAWVQTLDQKDPLEKGVATHSSVLVWRTPWTEEPGWPWPMGSPRVRRLSD